METLRKAPASARFKQSKDDLLKFSQEEIGRCDEKRMRRERIRKARLSSIDLSNNDDHFLQKAEALLDTIDGCSAIDRLNRLEEQVARLPSLDSLARYDIVYIFIQDLKRLTGKNHVRIEDIGHPTFLQRFPQARTLLQTIERDFKTVENGVSVSGITNFLSITQDVAVEHGNSAHLTAQEKAEKFDYNRLAKLCDSELLKVLDIVRSYSSNAEWPLLRTY